jgi:hypothetical protein
MKQFAILYKYVLGKATDEELAFSSKLIDDVSSTSKGTKETVVEFKFKSIDDMCKIFDLYDETCQSLHDYRSGYYYDDYDDTYVYDFKEGYISFYYYLNEENKKLFAEISKKILGVKTFDINNVEGSEFTKILLDLYEDDINSINYDLGHYMSRAKREEAREDMKESINDLQEKFGIDLDIDYLILTITTIDLLNGLVETNSIESGYKGFFKKVFNNLEVNPYYEYDGSSSFDYPSFNKEAEHYLEKILDKINEDTQLNDKINKRNKIISLFGSIGETIPLPSNKKYQIKFIDYDINEDLFLVKITIPEKKQKLIKINYENLLNLFYNPTLFELDDIY